MYLVYVSRSQTPPYVGGLHLATPVSITIKLHPQKSTNRMAFRTITSEIAKKKKDGGAIIGRTMAFITGAPTAVSEFTSPVYSTFSEGDRVVVQAVREKAVSGTVRWAGSLKASKGTGGMVRVLGIELVSG